LKNVFDNILFVVLNFERLVWRNWFDSSFSKIDDLFHPCFSLYIGIVQDYRFSRRGASATHPDDPLCGPKWQSHVTVRTASSAAGSNLRVLQIPRCCNILESEALESWSRLQRRLSWPSHVAATWVRMDGSVGWVALAFLLARNSLSCSTPFIKKIQTKHFKTTLFHINNNKELTISFSIFVIQKTIKNSCFHKHNKEKKNFFPYNTGNIWFSEEQGRRFFFFFSHNTGNIWFSEARRCRSVQHYRISPVRKILRVETCTFFSQAETIVWVLAHKLVSRPKWRVNVFLLFDFFRRQGFFFWIFKSFKINVSSRISRFQKSVTECDNAVHNQKSVGQIT